jgi:hypothetical protein
MDIVNRLPQLRMSEGVRRALLAIVLDALDQASCLTSVDTPRERPRSLRTPQKFLERNVWFALEHAFESYAQYVRETQPATAGRPALLSSLNDLLATPTGGAMLSGASIQSLDMQALAGLARALVVEIRPPDATFWAQTMLWAAWLFGEEVAPSLRGFLRRRRLDWDWYRHSLATAMTQLRPLLHPDASVLMMSVDQTPDAVRAALDAGTRAGMRVDRWIICAPHGYRLLMALAPGGDAIPPPPHRPSVALFSDVLARRGEPTRFDDVMASTILVSRDPNLPTPSLAEESDLAQESGQLVWLTAPGESEPPLSDRVEALTLKLLIQQPRWQREDLVAAVYDELGDGLSPEPELADACVDAYCDLAADGHLHLRAEDDPKQRRAEVHRVRREILELGQKLGYGTSRRLNGDILWQDENQQRVYLFRCTMRALLGPHLLSHQPPCDGRRCLILPGGRAALTALKLRRDPRMASAAREHRWTFIKFRHLRRMVEEIKERGDMEAYLGLDPLVEQDTAQLPLPLDIAGASGSRQAVT